jgi:hypothetical protein
VHHFSAGGLYNGLVLLIDDETHTYWDHITGEAVHGPLQGHVLPNWPVLLTTKAAALARQPNIEIYLSSHRSLISMLMKLRYRNPLFGKGFLPPFFRKTMSEPDPRLPELAQGLGVVVGRRARYYPLATISAAGIEDDWHGRRLGLRRGELDGIPTAVWQDDGSRPFQLLSRWYGFSYTYPKCEIFYSHTKTQRTPRKT